MSRYKSDQETHDFLKLLETLAFLPPELVQQAYNVMKPRRQRTPAWRDIWNIKRRYGQGPMFDHSEILDTEVRNIFSFYQMFVTQNPITKFSKSKSPSPLEQQLFSKLSMMCSKYFTDIKQQNYLNQSTKQYF